MEGRESEWVVGVEKGDEGAWRGREREEELSEVKQGWEKE